MQGPYVILLNSCGFCQLIRWISREKRHNRMLSKRQIPLMNRALSMIVSTLCLTIATAFSQLNENIGPGGNEDKIITTKAPSGQFSLAQTQANPPLKSCEESWACYQTTVHFQDKSKPDRVLPEVGLSDHVSYQAAANYVISPDERWFVRDQHIFAGWNVLVLYRIEPDGQVREVTSNLRDIGLKCVLADLRRTKKGWANVSLKDFFHVSAENVSWNSSSDVVHFEVFARPDPVNPKLRALRPIIDGWGVDYNVKTNKMTMHSTDN
jgi:hypothetical protein